MEREYFSAWWKTEYVEWFNVWSFLCRILLKDSSCPFFFPDLQLLNLTWSDTLYWWGNFVSLHSYVMFIWILLLVLKRYLLFISRKASPWTYLKTMLGFIEDSNLRYFRDIWENGKEGDTCVSMSSEVVMFCTNTFLIILNVLSLSLLRISIIRKFNLKQSMIFK